MVTLTGSSRPTRQSRPYLKISFPKTLLVLLIAFVSVLIAFIVLLVAPPLSASPTVAELGPVVGNFALAALPITLLGVFVVNYFFRYQLKTGVHVLAWAMVGMCAALPLLLFPRLVNAGSYLLPLFGCACAMLFAFWRKLFTPFSHVVGEEQAESSD